MQTPKPAHRRYLQDFPVSNRVTAKCAKDQKTRVMVTKAKVRILAPTSMDTAALKGDIFANNLPDVLTRKRGNKNGKTLKTIALACICELRQNSIPPSKLTQLGKDISRSRNKYIPIPASAI